MPATFDVIVVGLGAMGSSAAFHLASRGQRVLGLERYAIPHAHGSSHGFSRVIRLAYFEHPDYVPLLQRSYENWFDLEKQSNQKILYQTGGLYMGAPDAEAISGSLRAMKQFNIPHQELTRAETMRRHPMFRIPEDYVGLWEEATGFLIPERAVSCHCELAMRKGAELHGHEPVTSWQATSSGVRVTTNRATYEAARVVFCGGAWASQIVGDMGVSIYATRQTLLWVWPKKPELFTLEKFPVFMLETGPGQGQHYGFPMMPDNPGFKIAQHVVMQRTDPDRVQRDPQPGDEETVRPVLRDMIPDADGPLLAIRTCLYENSPDSHFIIDNHPKHPNVTLACGFSGHGFKFASVVGEAVADLSMQGKSKLPIGFLSLSRFGR